MNNFPGYRPIEALPRLSLRISCPVLLPPISIGTSAPPPFLFFQHLPFNPPSARFPPLLLVEQLNSIKRFPFPATFFPPKRGRSLESQVTFSGSFLFREARHLLPLFQHRQTLIPFFFLGKWLFRKNRSHNVPFFHSKQAEDQNHAAGGLEEVPP